MLFLATPANLRQYLYNQSTVLVVSSNIVTVNSLVVPDVIGNEAWAWLEKHDEKRNDNVTMAQC